MILIDLSQIMVASTMMSMGKDQSQVDISMVRHMVLNSLRMYRSKYHKEYGELVLCCDGRHSWRRDHFPQYKAARKTNRDADSKDWTQIFGCLDTICNCLFGGCTSPTRVDRICSGSIFTMFNRFLNRF